MSLANTLVSYVDNQITVKIPVAEVPAVGSPLPFTIKSTSYAGSPPSSGGQTAMDLSSVIPTTAGGFSSYSITASPTSTYIVQAGTSGSASTPILMPGERYELQLPSGGGSFMSFKNLDTTAPTLDSITTLSAYNLANGTTYAPPGGAVVDQSKTYFVAKFSEAVFPPSSQSFSVTQNGTSLTTTPSIMPLTLTGSVLSTGGVMGLPAASLYLVAVDNTGSNLNVALKTAPTILSVQEMNAAPLPADVTGQSYGSNSSLSPTAWLKVSMTGDAGQFLIQNPTVPMLQYELAGDPIYGTSKIVTPPVAAYVVAGTGTGTGTGVLYFGFNNTSSQSLITDAPISIKFQNTDYLTIRDTANNSLVPSAGTSVTAAKYLDATGEPVFSKWGDDTTTISNASVAGYANAASVTPNVNAPRYYTDGVVSKNATTGIPLYDEKGDRIGLDTIDLSGITGTPITINASKGEAYVYVGGKKAILDVSDYDRYVLNDRAKDSSIYGNEFYGTVDSDYVVVGSGGDNYLVGRNQGATDISSSVVVRNYKFSSSGIVAETDIVDYSQLDTGITVDLGNWAAAPVSVSYKDGTIVDAALTGRTQQDTLIGFEGVVGSRGADEISGSNVGNALAGGAGNDVLKGYSGAVDSLYTPAVADYGTKGISGYKEAQFLVDSSDILYGGAGDDKLYGGAGRDLLIDLGKAEMWGSNTGRNAVDGTVTLRSSAVNTFAENDVFMVRGDGEDKATINNFHLSKNGTGLAGRSNSANDAIIFSVDTTKLFVSSMTTDQRYALSNDYNAVYKNLTFEQTVINTDDIKLDVIYKKADGTLIKVGSTIIADIASMMNGGANEAQVVDMKWLTNGSRDDPAYLFNPKIDMDIATFVDTNEFGKDLNIAIALELLQAGTVRSTNEFGVMAAKLVDNDLSKRVYNPGDQNDRILGTTNSDSYDYVVQKFSESLDINVGNDAIFDNGGYDVLTFESAAIEKLNFSAVQIGRESHANSLRVTYEQSARLDGDSTVINRGEVTWQGHFQEGGRHAAEGLQILGRDYAIAQASYEYDSKGYVKGGPKITADNARDVIMVGQGTGDKFVFDFDPAAVRGGTSNTQAARIAGFDSADRIDISDYVAEYGTATASLAGGKAVVAFAKEGAETFKLELTFQDFTLATDAALQLALYGTIPT